MGAVRDTGQCFIQTFTADSQLAAAAATKHVKFTK